MAPATDEPPATPGPFGAARTAVQNARDRVGRSLLWGVWERMLETEFVDRSVALAGKAFISFFPLVIVVAAFMPASVRTSIFATLTGRLGIRGEALELTQSAFTTASDVRRATGIVGLVLTFFFASSFTTALQRIYLRAWRRPRDLKVGSYTRGLVWLVALLVYLAVTGAIGTLFGAGTDSGAALIVAVPLAFIAAVLWWWFTGWYLLLGHVRWRALLPSALVTATTMVLYAVSATVWMPTVVTKNLDQFGFFGVALALVTWFSGASICLVVGACVGPVFGEDPGTIGQLSRGRTSEVLVAGAPASLGPPSQGVTLRDAFGQTDDDNRTEG